MRNTFTVKLSRMDGREHEHPVIKNVVSIQSNLRGFLIKTTDGSYQVGSDTVIVIIGSDDYYEGGKPCYERKSKN